MATPSTRLSPDGVEYQAAVAFSPVLAEISNTPTDFGKSEKTFWAPANQTEKVLVYVLELDYSTEDLLEAKSRIEFLKYDQYKPEIKKGSHGEQVINILAGASFGVARSKNIKIIPVRGTNQYPHDEESNTAWKGALVAIAKHFKEATLHRSIRYGVLNCSRAFERVGNIEDAFKQCVEAGIIIIGAAGNRAVDLDKSNKSRWPLPEAQDETILIGSVDANGDVYKEVDGNDGSSYGKRVNYWVRGINIAYKHGAAKVNGTSFGMFSFPVSGL
ncbi:hypothetical protein COL922a_012482 [Colletotrichum nupharicola]|nr:hypothetical protein COL922a_012482 [Colletotrichum nupharicola]